MASTSNGSGPFERHELQKAIELEKEALKQDKSKNYHHAFRLYWRTVEHYLNAIKNESPINKSEIRQKCNDYLKRAEHLKETLRQGASSAPYSQVSGSKYKDGDVQDDPEIKKMQAKLQGATVVRKPDVQWSDILGLEAAKQSLKQAIFLPLRFPHLLSGGQGPWKGILLYGLPGSGKTSIAKAIASEAHTSVLFSISISHLLTTWVGDTENLIRSVFEHSRSHKPSIVFIDEIDLLFTTHNQQEAETARRIKTELLVQIQAVDTSNDGVIILGTCNKPWLLDAATRRRFDKRIYIPLPHEAARVGIFRVCLGNTLHTLSDDDFRGLGKRTNGFSGEDIRITVHLAMMLPLKKVENSKFFRRVHGPSRKNPNETEDDLMAPCNSSAPGAIEMSWHEIAWDKILEPPVTMDEMNRALNQSKPTSNDEDLRKLHEFTSEFGQEG